MRHSTRSLASRSGKTLVFIFTLTLFITGCKKETLIPKDNLDTNIMSAETNTSSASPGVTDKFIIISKTESVSTSLKNYILNNGGTINSVMSGLGVIVATSTTSSFITTIKSNNEVFDVVPDFQLNMLRQTVNPSMKKIKVTAATGLTGTNPISAIQWNLKAVDAYGAFAKGYKGNGAIVAVLDNGFYMNHPDIAPNVYSSVSFVPGETAQFQNPNYFSHGTHVAGIIAAADNNVGTVGIAPKAKLMLVKVLSEEGYGEFGAVIQGMYYAADNGANIINMSLGAMLARNGKFTDDNGTPDPSDDVVYHDAKATQSLIIALNRAVAYGKRKGVLTIAAAGNVSAYVTGQGQESFYPADCTGVIGVSATGPLGWATNQNTSLIPPAFYTNYGSSLIDLAGPGGNLKFPFNTNVVNLYGIIAPAWVFDLVISDEAVDPVTGDTYYAFAAGTSMASPAVAGVAAIIAGKYPGISVAQLQSKLIQSAVNVGGAGSNHYYGQGIVNASQAADQ